MTKNFTCVYLLNSTAHPSQHYSGITSNLLKRLQEHNAANVTSTAKSRPWHIATAIAFRNSYKAFTFERYLKSHSGRAFACKHFWEQKTATEPPEPGSEYN